MDFKFTQLTEAVFAKAMGIATKYGATQVNMIHLWKALLEESTTKDLFDKHFPQLTVLVDQELGPVPHSSNKVAQGLDYNLMQIVKDAYAKSHELGDTHISIDIMIFALYMKSTSLSTALKLSTDKLLASIIDRRKNKSVQSENDDATFNSLKKYTKNLTILAKDNKLDPVIGRDNEIKRTMSILCRRTKNNPVFIGLPGVGKTAIVEGLAQRIANGDDVPATLQGVNVLLLDMAALIAGAKYRGEFEERLKSVIEEIEQNNSKIILFIDEVHMLVGAGRTDGAMDAANILKPALARGELRCIGATTPDEYSKYIEKDAALERRFQAVNVNETTEEETLTILCGLQPKYELHHGVLISMKAMKEAVRLSGRYMKNRFFPDKAIDLIDEACSRVQIAASSEPEVLGNNRRKLIQLQMELQSVIREEDLDSVKLTAELKTAITQLSEDVRELTARWEQEKQAKTALQDLKKQLEHYQTLQAEAIRQGSLEKAAELSYKKIPELQQQIQTLSENSLTGKHLLKEEVTAEDVAKVVSQITSIPLEKMIQTQAEQLINMEEILNQQVIGQEQALNKISNAVRRARTGLNAANRPLGVFLCLGPTGVGKTKMAKALASFLFHDESAILRIDMSEYMERHNVSRLIGSPPGYIGHENGGYLTEAVKRKSYQIILCDEIEKAHPDVFDIFLQVFDEGRLTDGKGVTIDFSNTIILLTSNLGSDELMKTDPNKAIIPAIIVEKVMEDVQKAFRPEFLNRLDDIIFFNRLGQTQIEQIIDLEMKKLTELLQMDYKVHLTLDASAKSALTEEGYDPMYGARPVKRTIQKNIQDLLAQAILKHEISEGSNLRIVYDKKTGYVIEQE